MRPYVLVFFLLTPLIAQTMPADSSAANLSDYYDQNVLSTRLSHWGYTAATFMQGETKLKGGVFGGTAKLRSVLQASPKAAIEFEKYRKKNLIGYSLYSAGLAMAIASIVLVYVEDIGYIDSTPFFTLYLGGMSTTIAGIPFVYQSGNHLHKAVWEYNKYILLNKGF